MSKAGEWAKAKPAACEYTYGSTWRDARTIATVDEFGSCRINGVDGAVTFAPEIAVHLARWILDTFGEPAT